MKFTVNMRTEEEITNQIKEVLDLYVQPAVEQHGGQVNFLKFNQGVLTPVSYTHLTLPTILIV